MRRRGRAAHKVGREGIQRARGMWDVVLLADYG